MKLTLDQIKENVAQALVDSGTWTDDPENADLSLFDKAELMAQPSWEDVGEWLVELGLDPIDVYDFIIKSCLSL